MPAGKPQQTTLLQPTDRRTLKVINACTPLIEHRPQLQDQKLERIFALSKSAKGVRNCLSTVVIEYALPFFGGGGGGGSAVFLEPRATNARFGGYPSLILA